MRFTLILSVALLSACASNDRNQVAGAVVTPFSDLNLVKTEIPGVLSDAQKAPYAFPQERACNDLAASVHELDEVLGPDFDAPPSGSNPNLVERGGSAAVGAVQSAAEGVIPFRGWVRKLSGADSHSKRVAAAIAAGTHRRSFLKGVAKAGNC
jgi:hypothetical protein